MAAARLRQTSTTESILSTQTQINIASNIQYFVEINIFRLLLNVVYVEWMRTYFEYIQ